MRILPSWPQSWMSIVVFAAVATAPLGAAASTPKWITARAGILVDRATGTVLWQHNPDAPLPPASTTKVVTASLALQSNALDEVFPVSAKAAAEPPSKIGLNRGWQLRLDDLVYSIMLNSANDASVVIAEGLSGSVPEFATRMNLHAYMLGARSTHFVNPNGLPADNHVSSARDLALIFDHALENPGFRDVLETTAKTIRPIRGSSKPIGLRSKNRLLEDYRYRVIGKTGWTRAAKKCFVGAANANGREIIVAILGADDMWGDLRRLIEFGFEGGPRPVPRARAGLQAAEAPPSSGNRAVSEGDEAVTPGGRHFVRVATFQGATSAQRLQRELRAVGFPAQVFQIKRSGRTQYRVSVGGYPNRNAAVRAQQRIERHRPTLKTLLVRS